MMEPGTQVRGEHPPLAYGNDRGFNRFASTFFICRQFDVLQRLSAIYLHRSLTFIQTGDEGTREKGERCPFFEATNAEK